MMSDTRTGPHGPPTSSKTATPQKTRRYRAPAQPQQAQQTQQIQQAPAPRSTEPINAGPHGPPDEP